MDSDGDEEAAISDLEDDYSDNYSADYDDELFYVVLDEGALIMPVRPTSTLFRSLRYDGPVVTLEDMERAIAEGASKG